MNIKEQLITIKNKIKKLQETKPTTIEDIRKSHSNFAFKHIYVSNHHPHIDVYTSMSFSFPYRLNIEDGFKVISYYHDEICKYFNVEPFSKQAFILLRALLSINELSFHESNSKISPTYLLSISNPNNRVCKIDDSKSYKSWYVEGVKKNTIKDIYENNNYHFEDVLLSYSEEEEKTLFRN